MTLYAIFTPEGEPLYWTRAESPAKSWRRFVPNDHPARAVIMLEARRARYEAREFDALLLNENRIKQYRRSDDLRAWINEVKERSDG